MLIELARVAKNDRILVAGSLGTAVFIELRQHGCTRIVVTACRGLPRGPYDAALVPWYRDSLKALNTTLNWLVPFVRSRGVVAIWVARDEDAANRKLRSMLDRLGFRIEVGTTCENGLAVVARRREAVALAMAA
jgi:hypothetical protein